MRRLCHEVGRRPATSIGVEELEDVRELFKDAGNCLRTINGQITRIRASFDYGVARKYFPAYVARDLKALPRLSKGRVNKAVKPVPEDVFQQTREHMPPEAQDLVDVLWHCGARSGELFKLRVEDLQQPLPRFPAVPDLQPLKIRLQEHAVLWSLALDQSPQNGNGLRPEKDHPLVTVH